MKTQITNVDTPTLGLITGKERSTKLPLTELKGRFCAPCLKDDAFCREKSFDPATNFCKHGTHIPMDKWSRENQCFISSFVLGSADDSFNLDSTTLTMSQIKVIAKEYKDKQTPARGNLGNQF